MEKRKAVFATITLVSAIVLLAFYSVGFLGGDDLVNVEGEDFHEFIFSGGILDGLFSGYGSVRFNDGERYRGNFRNGRFDGTGTFFSDEWNFHGIFKNGRVIAGTLFDSDGGMITYEYDDEIDMLSANDWSYTGRFNERGQYAFGMFVFADGTAYTGDFLRGLANGEGVYADADGRIIYAGAFVDGMFDGRGYYFSPDGWSYEGGFRDGLFDGEGTITDGAETTMGIWEMGVQVERHGEN